MCWGSVHGIKWCICCLTYKRHTINLYILARSTVAELGYMYRKSLMPVIPTGLMRGVGALLFNLEIDPHLEEVNKYVTDNSGRQHHAKVYCHIVGPLPRSAEPDGSGDFIYHYTGVRVSHMMFTRCAIDNSSRTFYFSADL